MSKRRSFVGCVRPSFAEGMGRILDFGNTLSSLHRLGESARYKVVAAGRRSAADVDREAMVSDWSAVGQDIRAAMRATTRGQARSKIAKAGQRAASDADRVVGTVPSGARTR